MVPHARHVSRVMARALLRASFMRTTNLLAAIALAAVGALPAAEARAAEPAPRGIDLPQRDTLPPGADEADEPKGPHTGFAIGVTPGLAIDVDARSVGFSSGVEGAYGVPFGPVVLAPGASAMFFVPKGSSVLMGFPELKILWPLTRVIAPYVGFGVGVGTDTKTKESGAAIRGAAGVRAEWNEFIGAGLEVAYQNVADVKILTAGLGPVVHF